MKIYPFGKTHLLRDKGLGQPHRDYHLPIMKYILAFMLICTFHIGILALLQDPAAHPLIKVHEKLAETLSLTDCWICRHISRHPDDPIGLFELPVSLEEYQQAEVYLVANSTWKCAQQNYNWYPKCVLLSNTQAEYPLSPLPENDVTHEMFPLCFGITYYGKNPEVKFMGKTPLEQCTYTLWFSNETGNWEIETEKKWDKNWVMLKNGTQFNYTLQYWNLTIGEENVLLSTEGIFYSLAGSKNKDEEGDPMIIARTLLGPLWSARCSHISPWANVSFLREHWKDYKYCKDFVHTSPEGVGMPRIKYSLTHSQIQGGMFFVCGKTAYKILPLNWEGVCSLAYLAPNITVLPHILSSQPRNLGSFAHRYKRGTPILEERKNWVFQLLHVLVPGFGVFDLQLAIVNMSAELGVAFNATRQAINEFQLEVNSVAQLAVQNRLALDLLTMQQGGTCALIQHEYHQKCCYYVNKSSQIELDVEEIRNAVKIFEKGGDSELGNFSMSWFRHLFDGWGWLFQYILLIMALLVLGCALIECCGPILSSCLTNSCRNIALKRKNEERAMLQRQEIASLMTIDGSIFTDITSNALPEVVYVPMTPGMGNIGVKMDLNEDIYMDVV